MQLSQTWAASLRRLAWAAPEVAAPVAVDVAMLLGYVVCRSTEYRLALAVWFVAAILLAIRWPASGLGIGVAVALFPEPIRSGLTPGVSLVAFSALGFTIDYLARVRPANPASFGARLVAAGVATLAVVTFLATIHSLRRFEPGFAATATLRWTEMAAGLGVLLLASRALTLGSKRALWLGLAGVVVALTFAIVESLFPDGLRSIGLRWVVSASESSRATGPCASPNRLGTVAALAAVTGVCGLFGGGSRRWWWAGLAALGTLALALSFSRGALLGAGVALAAIVYLRRDRVPRTVVRLLAIGAVIAVPALIAARLTISGGTLDGLVENDVGRVDAWLAGIRMILAQPLLGHGFGAFAVLGQGYGATDGLLTAHNELIDLWAQAGIGAAAGFVAIVVGAVTGAFRRRDDPWALAALGAVAVFVIASSFNVQSPFLAVTGPVWLLAAFGTVATREPGLAAAGQVD